MKYELEKFNQDVSDADLLADIKRVAGELGQTFITIRQYEKSGKFNASTPKRRFGSWSAVLEKIGLQKIRQQKNNRITEEELFRNGEEVWALRHLDARL